MSLLPTAPTLARLAHADHDCPGIHDPAPLSPLPCATEVAAFHQLTPAPQRTPAKEIPVPHQPIRASHPLAGKTVALRSASFALDGFHFKIEDYWQNVDPQSRGWTRCDDSILCHAYAARFAFDGLPIDNEVLLGRIGTAQHLVHVSELGEEAL